MQAALPCLLFSNAPTELSLRGGTNAEMAPQVDYTMMVSHAFKYMCLMNVEIIHVLTRPSI